MDQIRRHKIQDQVINYIQYLHSHKYTHLTNNQHNNVKNNESSVNICKLSINVR